MMKPLAGNPWVVAATLVSALVASMLVAHAQLATSGGAGSDRGERRRVILVAGICSTNPSDSFSEVYQWLQNELKYDVASNEILLFSYAADGQLPYTKSDSTVSIDGAGGSAERLRQMIKTATDDGSTVDIVAHSQGGVVSLYAALDFLGQPGPSVTGRIHSITTIESPLQGVDWGRSLVGAVNDVFNCGGIFDFDFPPSIDDMGSGSSVITAITQRTWTDTPNPFVVTIANTQDQIVSDWACGGENGTLPLAHMLVSGDFGGTCPDVDPLIGGEIEAHGLPLKITTNPLASSVKNALLRALVEYQLQVLFLAADSYLRASLDAPAVTPLPLTLPFVGNESSGLLAGSVSPAITTGFVQTEVFLGNESSGVLAGNAKPSIATGFGLSQVFTGNVSSRLAVGLSDPFVTPTPPPTPTPTATPIPSVSGWGVFLLAGLLVLLAAWRLGRKPEALR